ncbi:MAG: B12-binding domain-containing radical SAM protein [Desulfuromonas sp.]|nr:MAG: B12-binding domain-containing radical SAM protein [Desulfuromonas sp.]
MNILLVNPPNCGRSIPEERYGIDSLKQIFRGEPLALEVVAAGLGDHAVTIVDLKADNADLEQSILQTRPDLIGFTAMTCEANTVKKLARQARNLCQATLVVGGIHASNVPQHFNEHPFDFIVIGLGKDSFSQLAAQLDQGQTPIPIPGIARVTPGQPLDWTPRQFAPCDQPIDAAPRYDLVERYRKDYFLAKLNVDLGFVVTAFGCPYNCSFCCIAGQCGGQYLSQPIEAVVRDLQRLSEIPFIRLVDANTFGSPVHAEKLCQAIRQAGIKKNYLIDVRADTVVRHPDLLQRWKEIGLRSVVIGFEEINDQRLATMNKQGTLALNDEALERLAELEITVVGDFIVDPDYDHADFDTLERYISSHKIDLPMLTIMTPLPGTPMYDRMKDQITESNLDYYTLTNAVTRTRLPEKEFYTRYANLLRACHAQAKL